MSTRAAPLALAGVLLSLLPRPASPAVADDLRGLSLEELMEISVVSASRWEEGLGEAPATVLVLTRHELADRGYGDLSEILEDLPGMDPVRPYGATWFKSYWRGFRNDIGSSFLLLLDGMEMNHLYFRTAHVLSSIPLTAVDRIEIVYGPASSVYGANAFMGVINILTRDPPADGVAGQLRLEAGERETRIGDGWTAGRVGAWTYRLAGRWAEGNLDPDDAEGHAFSDPSLYSDPRLWGGFAADSPFGGRFSSPWRNRGLDLRLRRDGLELGASFFETSTGYGVEYAADRAQNLAVWRRPDLGLHLRWRKELGERVRSSTLVRYRESDVDEESFFVEAFEIDSEEGNPRRVDFSLWEAKNRSWTLLQDFDLRLRDDLDLSLGFALEEKELQKAYATVFGPSLSPREIDLTTYPFPAPGDQTGPPRNRIETTDLGLYAQSRWDIGRGQSVHAGIRWDDNSEYGSEVTYRGGWVGELGHWVLKALYGEAFQEPNPRVLFGGWKGSGSDPDLRPERSRTLELTAGTARSRARAFASLWRVDNEDLILTRGQVLDLEGEVIDFGGALNAGDQTIYGADLHGEALLEPRGLDRLRIWGFWTHLFQSDEDVPGENGDSRVREIGDLSENRILAGITAHEGSLAGTLRARWVGPRETVETNPVREIGSYATADLHVRWKSPVGSWPWSVGVEVTNLFDEDYAHPGVREASAGTDPGGFDAEGIWRGSRGFFNSVLPQPGRTVTVVIGVETP